MALEDYMEPEVGIAVALTAAVASPGVRKFLRRGAVYGLAGVLMAGDAVSSLAQGVKRGVQQSAPEPQPEAEVPVAPEILRADGGEPAPLETAFPEKEAAPKRARKTAEVPLNE